ncbi:chalcone isomerase family protein [Aquabacterium sp.]|uniref:chalcone isomerase family protein n=1 Tax=Aquabacterium sp. TaxID=1872578 RepID=UPI0035B277CF
MRFKTLAWLSIAILSWAASTSVRAEVVGELDGVQIEDSATVGGTKLLLNGAATRKRGYFKTDVTTLYLAEKCRTLECVYHAKGPKRIQLSVLRDLNGGLISRYFVSDFKSVATEAEFKQLITEVGQIGDLYGRLGQVKKGDVSIIDWVPGKGIQCRLNGKVQSAGGIEYMNSELMFQILLRMYVGELAAADYRRGLLGLDDTLTRPATAR